MAQNLEKPLKLLFVDDEAELLSVQSSILTDIGYDVVTAGSAEEALASSVTFDQYFLIISDFNMPGMNGLDLCLKVREQTSDVPFIVLTGYADKEMAMKGLEYGLTSIIEKPVDQDFLEKTIQIHAEKYRDKKEAQRKEMEEIAMFFVDEAKELYSDLEETILRLEEKPIDHLVVDVLFRKIHSVKGGSSAIQGAGLLAQLSHVFESCLSKIKNDGHIPSHDEVITFLDAASVSIQLLDLLRQNPEEMESLRTRVEALIQQMQNPTKATSEETARHQADHLGEASSIKVPSPSQRKDEVEFQDEEIMVKNSQLDQLMGMIGELVILKNYCQQMSHDLIAHISDRKLQSRIENFARSMEKSSYHLQDQILEIRKVPLKKLTGKVTRLVHQSAKMLGKKVYFTIVGDEMSVDKSISTAVGTCLTHMVRNSMDHGLEKPEERILKGKNGEGRLAVVYQDVKGAIEVKITDDGRGLNIAKIREKAMERGLLSEQQAQNMAESEIAQMIFLPGFSTAEKITDVSGRGVGMDAALSMVQRLNGRIQIESTGPQGTVFKIRIPFLQTISVEHCLVVEVDNLLYAIPIESVRLVRKGAELQTCDVNGQMVAVMDDGSWQLLTLSQDKGVHGQLSKEEMKKKMVVTVLAGHHRYGLIVDRILYQTEAVTQKLPDSLNSEVFVLGSTILGDDQIAYVLEMQDLYKAYVEKLTNDNFIEEIAS